MTSDPIWDEPFHAAAFSAFIELAVEQQGWPDPEKTKQRAYTIYEDEKRKIDEGKGLR